MVVYNYQNIQSESKFLSAIDLNVWYFQEYYYLHTIKDMSGK